jgi:hypothetical protein
MRRYEDAELFSHSPLPELVLLTGLMFSCLAHRSERCPSLRGNESLALAADRCADAYYNEVPSLAVMSKFSREDVALGIKPTRYKLG